MTSNRQSDTPADEPGTRQGSNAKVEAVEASTMEAAPADQLDVGGGSFYNPALVASGTIMPDGTYGAPLPDPNLAKRQEDPEVTTDLDEAAPATTGKGPEAVSGSTSTSITSGAGTSGAKGSTSRK